MGDGPLRIAFFTNTFVPDVNGVALCIRILRQELLRQGHKVYVFAPAPVGEDPLRDDPLVLRFPSVPIFDLDYSLALPLSGAAGRTLRDVEFDVVHTHHPLWVGVWGAWYARRVGLPLVTTIHTQYEVFAGLVPLPKPIVKAYLRGKVRRYCNRCHVVTTPSAETARRLKKLGVKSRIAVVHNPIDLAAFESADGRQVREKYGLEDKFILGYLGRLSREKQVHVLVDVLAKVRQRVKEAHLMVVGGGPAREELERLVDERGLGEAVSIVGPVPHSDVAQYHASFDVYLSASLGEVQPLSATEAMAAGTPVVAVEAAGMTELVHDGVNGFVVARRGAADEMAKAVIELAENEQLRQRLGEGARKTAERFSPSAIAEELVDVYAEAINAAGGRQ